MNQLTNQKTEAIISLKSLLNQSKTSLLPPCIVMRKHQLNFSLKACKLLNIAQNDGCLFRWIEGRNRLSVAVVKPGHDDYDSSFKVNVNYESGDVKICHGKLVNTLRAYDGYDLTVNGQPVNNVRFMLSSKPLDKDFHNWYVFE